jgi:hypothetical protein
VLGMGGGVVAIRSTLSVCIVGVIIRVESNRIVLSEIQDEA